MGNDRKEQIGTPECEIFGVSKRYVTSTKDWLAQTPPGLATTYLNKGWSFFPISKTEKTPLSKALPMGRWKPYQARQPTSEELGAWFTDYSEWPGGDGFNLAIATGVGGLYVVDIDVAEIPPELVALHTTTVRTHRGHHLYFTRAEQPALTSKRLELFGIEVEFKALGQYVVAPPSKLMNADGSILHEYRFDIPLALIKPLPASILEQLRKAGTSLDGSTPSLNAATLPLNGHTRTCIAKLMTYDRAPVGERDTVLWVLYWRMIVAGAKKQIARETVRRLNEKFASPCSRRELESFVFGAHHEYHLGCGGTVARLPWIKTECCPGCPENRRKTSLALKKLGLEEAIKARPVDTSLIAVLIWRAKLNARGGNVSVMVLAKESGLAENTVRAAVERAKGKGLWEE